MTSSALNRCTKRFAAHGRPRSLRLTRNTVKSCSGRRAWYCFDCGALVHRVDVKVTDLEKDLPPLYEAFYRDENARTCKKCGAIHPGKKPPLGWA